MSEIYISTDVETDGPIPGEYSMLSLGSVAFNEEGEIINKFYEKIKPLERAKQHPKHMEFWENNAEAYKEATSNPKTPEEAIKNYVEWLEKLKSNNEVELIFLGWPLTFDYMFTYWYMIKFGNFEGKDIIEKVPFSFNKGIDVNSFVMAHLNKPFLESKGKNMPKRWFENVEGNHNHKAVDDAEYEGKIFIRMLKENQGRS